MTTWLISSTFYGQWLPGNARGSITNVHDKRTGDEETTARIEHDVPGEDYEEAMPQLERAARERLKGPPVCVDLDKAEELLAQFQETARYRGWELLAVSIMFNHVHLVVAAPTDVGKSQLLRDFKSYGARRLNQQFGPQPAGTWWTESGSCRPVRNVAAANFYVCHRQPRPLVVWSKERGRISPDESDPSNVFGESASEPPASEPPASEPPA